MTVFFGLGIRRRKGDKILDVLFPKILSELTAPQLFLRFKSTLSLSADNGFIVLDQAQLQAFQSIDSQASLLSVVESKSSYFTTEIIFYSQQNGAEAVQSTEEAYFKLQCISQRLVKPHEFKIDGLFGKLNNIAWSNKGPILIEDLDEQRLNYLATDSPLIVSHVDKFPYLVNYHVPSGVRIASGSQVRLGAYLGEGTTIMPAGYVNFNAGTLGSAMIEGRVSAGVVVGNNSDVGGGASIMGTLSGGNNTVISIGEQCLLGANSGTGISLGKGCTIAAGLYIYAGMKVSLYNHSDLPVNLEGDVVTENKNTVKAYDLSGRDYLLFIQDSRSGRVICKPNKKLITLNEQLHHND
jgi:2,3,4,5-tetrahydropyridine-2-carboxylate N-succinyltransferase